MTNLEYKIRAHVVGRTFSPYAEALVLDVRQDANLKISAVRESREKYA